MTCGRNDCRKKEAELKGEWAVIPSVKYLAYFCAGFECQDYKNMFWKQKHSENGKEKYVASLESRLESLSVSLLD